MRVEPEIRRSEELIQWLDSKINGLDIPNNDRARLAAGCLDMALEHQKSIVLLTANSLFGSAAALVRLEFEAFVRGGWLNKCASNGEIERFKADKIKRINPLIEDIEKLDAYDVGVLSHVKNVSWKVMNSFTHTGIFQMVRRNTADEIIPNYSDEELIDALDTANSIGFLSVYAIAEMAGDETLGPAVLERQKAFFGNAL